MRTRSRHLGKTLLTLGVVGLSLLGAACGGGSSSSAATGTSSTINIVVGPGGPFVSGLNPFSTSDSPATMGVTSLVYEPLVMFNAANPTADPKPWLASAYKWSDGGKTLTFTIPSGRKWSDGQAVTAKDVAFTFNLIKKNAGLNVNGVNFVGASAPSATTAVITFEGPGYTQFYNLAKVLIVPQHVWSSIADPLKYSNTSPIGSGPYKLQSINAQSMTFVRNAQYWQAGLPKVNTVRVVSYTSQNSAISALTAGQIDWANFFLSNPTAQFTGKDTQNNKMYLQPAGDFFLCPNTSSAPLNNATVRKAIAYSIDRAKAIPEVENKFYGPTTSVTGLRAGQTQFIPSALKSDTLSYDPTKVRSLLQSAGYTGGSSGLLKNKAGKTLQLSLLLPSAYSDWMSLGTLFVNEMKAAGIDASLDGVSTNAWTSNVATGDYQLTFCGEWSSGGPYTTLNAMLNGSLTAANGKSAISNVVRWNDPKTNKYLDQYASSGDTETQTSALQGIASIIAEQNPIIPLMSVSSFGEYSTKRFTGFPTAANNYQIDAIVNPYTLDVVTHLAPAK